MSVIEVWKRNDISVNTELAERNMDAALSSLVKEAMSDTCDYTHYNDSSSFLKSTERDGSEMQSHLMLSI